VAGFATSRPDHNHQPPIEVARCDQAGLAIIEPLIHDRRAATGEDLISPRKIQTAMPKGKIALCRIKGDPQIIVPPINVKAVRPRPAGFLSTLFAPGRAYFTVIAKPLRSALTIAPTELPVSVSTAPFGLVSTIACAPRPTAAPTLPAA